MYFPSIFKLVAAAAALYSSVLAGSAATTHHHKVRNAGATAVVPDSYIIVYHENVTAPVIEAHESMISSIIAKRDSGRSTCTVKHKYDIGAFKGYAIEADAATVNQIADTAEVDYVELDAIMNAQALVTENNAPWGLGRVSHRQRGSTDYIYDDSAGTGIYVYVLDSGIMVEHDEFGGRALWGHNSMGDGINTDAYGHGTHISGTIGGRLYGVAKNCNLIAVKVLDSSGTGSSITAIDGLNFVANDTQSHDRTNKSVVNISFSGENDPTTTALNTAVRSLVALGVPVVVAAGNYGSDASAYSPASEPSAITVAAIDTSDSRAVWLETGGSSNFGPSVDVWAPGTDVLSAWIATGADGGGATATGKWKVMNGTSMACPHVAGVAAYLMALEGLDTPDAVVARIKGLMTPGVGDARGGADGVVYNGDGA